MTRKLLLPLLFLALSSNAFGAPADDTCQAAEPLDGQRLLRRLSLDLRGTVPSYEEALEQHGKNDVSESKIEEMIRSPELVQTIRKFHEASLWPNLDQVDLVPGANMLYPYELAPGVRIYMSPLRAVFTRTTGSNLYVPCKPEPARFDADGKVIADPLMMGTSIIAYQEGYVEVEPYWAPGTRIKVCGFDAQTADSAPLCPGPGERFPFVEPYCQQYQNAATSVRAPFRSSLVSCEAPMSLFAPGCGCGPNLKLCHSLESRALLRKSLLDQELRIVEDVVSHDQPYHQILLTKHVEVNGPIAHYLTHQSRLAFDVYGDPDATSAVPPGLSFTDADRWLPVERTGRHSGILTTPGYLLRFQSNRSRANRFYSAFECSTFIPSGPLPSPFEPCSKHEDLTKRCGCDACHKALEPLASHWGRFSEYGLTPIDDARFPRALGQSCTVPISSVEQLFRCYRFYKIDAVGEEVPYRYQLNSYVFRTPEEVVNIEQGPALLANHAIQSGQFSTCTARKMWTHFMRRAPTSDEETQVIPDLVTKYEAANFNLKQLVRAIVLHPAYRRLP